VVNTGEVSGVALGPDGIGEATPSAGKVDWAMHGAGGVDRAMHGSRGTRRSRGSWAARGTIEGDVVMGGVKEGSERGVSRSWGGEESPRGKTSLSKTT
jgi:hypothetical protein